MISPRTPRDDQHELIVKNLTKSVGDKVLFSNISFSVKHGETLFIRGPSGVGKTLLLRSLAYLDPIDGGLTLDGQTPDHLGAPKWRSFVTYVFQQRISFKGTPSEFYYTAQRFASQRGRPRRDLPAIIHELGLEQAVLNQPWSELSGGQAQRVQIAIAIALNPLFLLLDEPTSALDSESTRRVERTLKSSGAALIWVSHDPLQPVRVGGKVLDLPAGILSAVTTPPISPVSAVTPSSLPRVHSVNTFHSPVVIVNQQHQGKVEEI